MLRTLYTALLTTQFRPLRPTLASICVALFLIGCGGGGSSSSDSSVEPDQPADANTQEVLLVGNNWDGTADILSVPGYTRLARINVVPDLEERKLEILTNPIRFAYYLAIQQLIGEGNDQLVDDMFASNDGKTLFVSRPSLADVVAIDIASGDIVWRTRVAGQRSDHMAISPDGERLAVSASTGNVVHILDTSTGDIVGEFESGDSPHENNYSLDGSKIFHASIGLIYTPFDSPILDTTKGERYFQIVDAETLEIIKRLDMGKVLEDAGYPNMSSAVRPMALSPDEKTLYFQVSFFHGFIEYDLEKNEVVRVVNLPLSDEAKDLPKIDYILDSAHHGIAINGAGDTLCIAGTMSNYAAMVDLRTLTYSIHDLGARTYWATTSEDGKFCYVSVAGDDTLSVFSYATDTEVARIPVGDHPQRVRTARIAKASLPE